jgi:hypothetical protein
LPIDSRLFTHFITPILTFPLGRGKELILALSPLGRGRVGEGVKSEGL